MSFGKIRIDPRDSLFSIMIRERDKRCVLCGDTHRKSENSHYWGRGNKMTRFDAQNCEYLCFTCHSREEGNKQGKYRDYKLKTLGQEQYRDLRIRASQTGKYGEYEQKVLMAMLKEDYKAKKHLEKGWLGYQLTMNGPIRRNPQV
jgi:Bacteriophage Lambda NinG protein